MLSISLARLSVLIAICLGKHKSIFLQGKIQHLEGAVFNFEEDNWWFLELTFRKRSFSHKNSLISVYVVRPWCLHPQNWLATLAYRNCIKQSIITRWCKDMKFYQLERYKQYCTQTEPSERTKYCFKHEKIRLISSSHRNGRFARSAVNWRLLGPECSFVWIFQVLYFSVKTFCLYNK